MKTLKIGDTVPSFEGVDQNNTKVTTTDFKGVKWVVYFYPKDNTPGCTIENKDFSCMVEDFKKM